MIKKEYSPSARRARNIIWNAAGRYDFDPPFLAFYPNGNPDHYFNMVIGLVEKWLDMPRLMAFFAGYATDRRADEFDELLWLGLENCCYEKEVEERPILTELRRQRAKDFYKEQENLSRQQMEYQSMMVYAQQEIRWAEVLGKRRYSLSEREKRMAKDLCFAGSFGTEEVLSAMRDFLRTYFGFEDRKASASPSFFRLPVSLHLGKGKARRDLLLVRTGTGEEDHPRSVLLPHTGLGRAKAPGIEEEAFVRDVFGPCSLSEQERKILEEELCTGADANCRLWVVKERRQEEASAKEAREVLAKRKKQREKNEAFWRENAMAIQGSIRSLSAGMETVLSSCMRHLPESASRGKICSEKAYRLPVLQDDKVFSREGERVDPEIFVDILLDASQSRMNAQEVLSAEAYILSQSLYKLSIPARIFSFRSLRGYTILEELKGASAKEGQGTFSYYAGGWNRDSLAIRTLGRLKDDPQMRGKKRILLVMTDASPNDSAPLGDEKGLLPHEYEGGKAVEATRQAVQDLKEKGIRVGAVFHGGTSHLEDLHRIYGHNCVRIRKASQLAQGVCELVWMLLAKEG